MNTASNSVVAREPKSPQSKTADLITLLKRLGPSFYALAVGTLYVSGFLVLNSNLAKSGVLDIEFVDARYFLFGASFVFFLICFYLFAGRAVLFSPKWLGNDLQRVNRDRPSSFWSLVVFVHSVFITAIFYCCLSAALFTTVAIGGAESLLFYGALAGSFFVLYTFDVTNLDVRFPRLSEIVTIVAELIAIYAFFVHIGSGAMLIVFITYMSIFGFINLVLDGFDRYKLTADRVTFSGIYAVVFLLATAIAFGTLLYGQVSSKLGGARPQTVSLGLTAEARKSLPPPFANSESQALHGKLIHQTPTYTYVVSAGHTLRLRTADVVTLMITTEPTENFWRRFLEQTFGPPSSSSRTSNTAGKPTATH